MSYDRMREETQTATCACGQGTVTRLWYYEMDDWNRTRDGYSDLTIHCNNCKSKYHIEHCTHHFSQPKWKGDGIRTDYYLVPNGKTVHHTANTKYFHFNLQETWVSEYPLESLKEALADMQSSRYSTRLSINSSRAILDDYFRRYKKKSLAPIISLLQECVTSYNSYEWTFEKMQVYKEEEKKIIDENNKIINEVLQESYPLNFN